MMMLGEKAGFREVLVLLSMIHSEQMFFLLVMAVPEKVRIVA
jgi:hypothetical protein